MDQLFVNLTEVHAELDLDVKEKQELVSEITKKIISIITSDTRIIQQNLLGFGQTKQMNQDQLYREWLQMYIEELDQWRSTRLANLQEKMEAYQKTIMNQSQRLIMQVNTESNTLKTNILTIAQQQGSLKMQGIIEQIQTISVHNLGTETMTKMNLIIHGNVGNKMPGQGCNFDFDQSHESDRKNGHGILRKQPEKKDLQKSKQLIIRKTTNVTKRIDEDQHDEQVSLHQHRKLIQEEEDGSYLEDVQDQDEQ